MREITYAYLETTTYCNLDCSFCNRRDVVKTPQHMSLERWQIVLDKLKDHPIKEAKLMGLGEPFLHPDFDEICKRFKQTFPECFVIVATNCQYKLNKRFVEALKYIDLLYLSVDGYKDNYEKNRYPAKWGKLIQFLDRLNEIGDINTRLTINYVVTDENYLDIEKVNRMVGERYPYVEEVRLNIAQWWGEGEQIDFEFNDDFFDTLKRYKRNVKGKSPWDYSDCFWPKSGFYMNADGSVRVCCLNTNSTPLGNIFTDDFSSILNSVRLLEIEGQCANNTPGIHCKSCDYKSLEPVLAKIRK